MKPAILSIVMSVLVSTGLDSNPVSGYLLGAVLAVVILGYLVYCLLKAEKF